MNIYIKPELEEQLRKMPSMSGLINSLLENYFTVQTLPTFKLDPKDLTDKQLKKIIKSGSVSLPPQGTFTDDPTYTDVEEVA